MPLIIHRSSDPDHLAAEAARILAEPTADPMAMDRIAVHSRGVQRWLSMQIAARNQIFGAAAFFRPEELVAQLAAETLGIPLETTWTAGELLWALLAELPPLLAEPSLRIVRDYIDAEGDEERTLRLVTLCQRLATVFQAYGQYRPDQAEAWGEAEPDEPWEAPLWRAVEDRLGATHMAAWAERLRGRHLPPTASRTLLFTVTTLPPLALRTLARLAGDQPIHLFALHPSPTAWERAAPEHPMLASLGTLASAFRALALSTEGVEHHLIEAPPPARDSLLHAIQADLHEDTLRPYTPDADDRSVQLHSCSSPLRQVQVLRDRLLEALDEPGLEPRDILVMTPDVEIYAPLVQAVFGDGAEAWSSREAHPAGFPSLPFRLADRGVRAQNEAADALLGLLDLAGSRLTAPEVFAFLALDPVRERFGLAASDLPRARELLIEAGARWGADASHRAREGLPADDRFTWRFAIDRLLLGQALSDPGRAMLLDHAPGCDVESLEDRRILGGLVDFLESLLAQVQGLTAPREPAAWFVAVSDALDALLPEEPERSWQFTQVTSVLDELLRQAQASSFRDAVDLRTLRTLLSDRFAAREPGRGFLAGAITVCQLVPLRSIPFRVVCLLGIDEGVFPRVQSRPGYDRMALDPRPGDRNAGIDDRALFLEAIQSARQTLILTCTGRSEQSGRELPLAVPIAELVDTVRAMGGPTAVSQITTRHALQPWSPQLFEAPPSSFDRRMLEAARAWREGRQTPVPVPLRFGSALPTPGELPAELELDAFVRFWRHPPSDLVKRRLGLSMYEDETELGAELPFALDGLGLWQVKRELIDEALAGRAAPTFAERAPRGADLPMGTPGRILLDDQIGQVDAFIDAVRPSLSEPHPPIDLDLPGEIRLTGRLHGLFASGRSVLQPGRVHPRQLLRLWIEHLALHASGWTGSSTLIGPYGGRRLQTLPRERAIEYLTTLCRGMHRGTREPLLFWADASHDALMGASGGPLGAFFGSMDFWRQRDRAVREIDAWVIGAGKNPFHPSFNAAPLAPPLAVARRVWEPVRPYVEEVAV